MKISIKNQMIIESIAARFARNQGIVKTYESLAESGDYDEETTESCTLSARRLRGENEGMEKALGYMLGFDMENYDTETTTGKKKGYLGWLQSKQRDFFLDRVIAASDND